jgi:hypothetical protein
VPRLLWNLRRETLEHVPVLLMNSDQMLYEKILDDIDKLTESILDQKGVSYRERILLTASTLRLLCSYTEDTYLDFLNTFKVEHLKDQVDAMVPKRRK